MIIRRFEFHPHPLAILPNALRRFDASQRPRKLGPDEGEYTDLLAIGVRFMVWTEESGGGLSLVEYPIPPRTLAAPLHLHTREDEYSFVLEGRTRCSATT